MLIARATLMDGTACDLRVEDRIIEIELQLKPFVGEQVYDAEFGTLVPGLHDHHVHLRASAAALESVQAGPPQVRSRAALAVSLHAASPDADGWIRAVGYHDSVAGDLNRQLLDGISPPVPVRVQHRSGALWILNSAALSRLGVPEHPDGRFFRQDNKIPRIAEPSLRGLSDRLCGYGVTGVTEATPGYGRVDVETFTAARKRGELRQRLHCMAVAGTEPTGQVSIGPAKMILDDTTLDLDALCGWIMDSHDRDHPVAIHAVTDSQLVVTMAALRQAGVHPGDRIEHAAVVPPNCAAGLAELGVTVVTQPNFVAERGDEYLIDVPADQHDQLWPVASLLDAGVPLALSTDTPFGDADPWAVIRAATARTAPSGAVLGPAERITPATALALFFGHPERPHVPRRIAVGQPGDVCVVTGSPADVLADPDAGRVAATVVAGEIVFG
jgi:predicted amidohydrolase YtcJ